MSEVQNTSNIEMNLWRSNKRRKCRL